MSSYALMSSPVVVRERPRCDGEESPGPFATTLHRVERGTVHDQLYSEDTGNHPTLFRSTGDLSALHALDVPLNREPRVELFCQLGTRHAAPLAQAPDDAPEHLRVHGVPRIHERTPTYREPAYATPHVHGVTGVRADVPIEPRIIFAAMITGHLCEHLQIRGGYLRRDAGSVRIHRHVIPHMHLGAHSVRCHISRVRVQER